MTLKEIREKQARLVTQARGKLDEITDTTTQERATEIEREHDAIMAEYDGLEQRAKREERLAEAQRVIDAPDDRRPVEDRGTQRPQGTDADRAAQFQAAFRSYLRDGIDGCSSEQRALLRSAYTTMENRNQSAGTNSAGGYTVPTGFMAELVVALKQYGPMNDTDIIRDLATDAGNTLPWPTMNDTANKGRRITELTQVPLQDSGAPAAAGLQFGQLNLNAWKYTTDVVLVSQELLQDSGLDIEQIVRDAMSERMGRVLNTDLTVGAGSGSSAPNGIVTGASAGYTAASATAIVFDDLIELQHSVDPAYRKAASCRWQFNDSTLKAIRKLKDGDGQYIWQPAALTAGAPASILGNAYEVNQDMANIATTNVSVIFGDMKKYIRRRVREFVLRRLTERYADYDAVGFIGFMRADGNVLDSRAIKKLTHP